MRFIIPFLHLVCSLYIYMLFYTIREFIPSFSHRLFLSKLSFLLLLLLVHQRGDFLYTIFKYLDVSNKFKKFKIFLQQNLVAG
jgi:hypothetical protein